MYLFTVFISLLLIFQRVTATITPDSTPLSPIRISYFLTKNANLSDAEFHHQYSTQHGPRVAPWAAKHGILEYNQFHHHPSALAAVAPLVGSSVSVTPYDAYTEFLVDSMEVFLKALEDPFYTEVLLPEEAYLFGDSKLVITAGYRLGFWKADVGGVMG